MRLNGKGQSGIVVRVVDDRAPKPSAGRRRPVKVTEKMIERLQRRVARTLPLKL